MHVPEPGVDVPRPPQGVHDPEFVLQVPEKPDRVTLLSDVNLTCMYPVDDVYSVLGLTEVPDK